MNTDRIAQARIDIVRNVDKLINAVTDGATTQEDLAVRLQILAEQLTEQAGYLVGTQVALGFLADGAPAAEVAEHLHDVLTDSAHTRRAKAHDPKTSAYWAPLLRMVETPQCPIFPNPNRDHLDRKVK